MVVETVIRRLRTLPIRHRRPPRTRPCRTCSRYSRIIGNHHRIKYRYGRRTMSRGPLVHFCLMKNDCFQPQQTMYFVPPPGTAISVGQNPGDRQQLHQQQRFSTNYSFNAQTMTPPSQASCKLIVAFLSLRFFLRYQ